MLQLKGLEAFYGKSHILHGVDMRVDEGEIVSLLGRNGSGRSTTVKTIMGLVQGAGSVSSASVQAAQAELRRQRSMTWQQLVWRQRSQGPAPSKV